MFKVSGRARAVTLRALAGAACIQLLCGHGCSTPYPSQQDARLTVVVSQPSGTYQPGDTVAFRVAVTNAGTRDVDFVRVDTRTDRNLRLTAASCTGQGTPEPGSTTELACGRFTTAYKLPPGATMTSSLIETVHAAMDSTATNTIIVDMPSGPTIEVHNTVSLTDSRGGTYRAFTDRASLDARVDFASATIAFGDTGATTRPLALRDIEETYDMADGAALRAPGDLLVGTVDLGGGIKPFVAARRFVTTIAMLDGRSFNTFELDTPSAGSAAASVHTTSFDGSTMWECADAQPRAIESCPAASLRQYAVTVADGVFTATDAQGGGSQSFQVALSGDVMVLLRAEAAGAGRVLQVGLSTNSGIAPVTYEGGDTLGRWRTLQLLPSSAALREGTVYQNGWFYFIEGTLSGIPAGPGGLDAGTLGDAGSTLWVAMDGPLAVVIGQPGGPMAGLLQVFSR